MKILKYILLLLILSLVALFVYIATQNGAYTVSRSLFVNAPQNTVYNYINNLKTWEEWAPLEDLNKTNIQYEAIVKGDSAGFTWKDFNENGHLKTIKVIPKDSISQILTVDGNLSKMGWKFKSEPKGTMVTWSVEGTMTILMKITYFFQGGPESIIGERLDRGLANIKNYFTKELSEFTVDTKGLVVQGETYYIVEKVISDKENFTEEMALVAQSLIDFVKDNSLTLKGKPFAILERNSTDDQLSFSMCVPIAEEIFTTEDSQIHGRKLESSVTFNTVLKGDYSHIKTAVQDTRVAMEKTNQIEDFSKSVILVFETSSLETLKPSEWVTSIHIPLDEKAPAASLTRYNTTPQATAEEVPQPIMPTQVQ